MLYLLTDNILFSSKIAKNLKDNGVDVKAFVAPEAMTATLGDDHPTAILVNLNARKYDPMEVIRSLKAEGNTARFIGFCGHSDKATLDAGYAAGADKVLANSAITMNAIQALKDAGVDL